MSYDEMIQAVNRGNTAYRLSDESRLIMSHETFFDIFEQDCAAVDDVIEMSGDDPDTAIPAFFSDRDVGANDWRVLEDDYMGDVVVWPL